MPGDGLCPSDSSQACRAVPLSGKLDFAHCVDVRRQYARSTFSVCAVVQDEEIADRRVCGVVCEGGLEDDDAYVFAQA